MIITTTETIPGKNIKEIIGVVKGNTVQSRWLGSDIGAALKNLVGGELKGYTELLTRARDEALKRMIDEAKKIKADAVVNVRFSTSQIMQSSAEMLVYGTAVKLK
jgi:uncharacterized protein YbjQ (UPF0145 family)